MTLRITRAPEGSRFRATLQLEGSLVAEWASLLQRECLGLLQASALVDLDLTGVGFVDLFGLQVLQRLSRAGVGIHCPPGPVASVLEGAGIHVQPTLSERRATP